MSIPDFVQNTYSRVQANGLPGTIADGNPSFINSFVAETEIPFGRAISVGSTFGPPRAALLGGAAVAATAGYHIGSAITATLLQLKAITNGSITIVVDGNSEALTGIDFSSAADFAGIATVLTTKLTAAKGTFTFDSVKQCFKLTSATTGTSSKIGAITDGAAGTAIRALIGFDTVGITVDGAASRSAVMLGVSVRSLQAEAKSLDQSNVTVVKVGDVGAYLREGAIKVVAAEAVTANSAVYYDTTTGELYGTAGAASRPQLGSAKWQFDCAAGAVGVIFVSGL